MERLKPEIDAERIGTRLGEMPGVERIRTAVEATGADAYLVGGSVRDLLLGAARVDLDLAVEGDVGALARALGGELRAYERFATATVRLESHIIDLAATRVETYARPGALPEVRPASLVEDLARRDFTVNAMAIALRGEPRLIDPHEGAADLRARVLRVLHERSFVDDPTRALRGARYAARLDLAPDPKTMERLVATDLSTVSDDRIEAELRRLAGEPRAPRGFELLDEWGLLEVGSEALALVASVAAAASREPWSELGHREEAILAAARGTAAPPALAGAEPASPSQAVRLARGRAPHQLLLARAGGAEWLDRYLAEWRWVRTEIGGRDLLAAGVREGPEVGRGLAAALEARLDGRARSRDEELRVALEAAGASPKGA